MCFRYSPVVFFFLQNLCVSFLYLIKAHKFTQDYIWMKSRSQKQRNILYYEKQLSFRDHAISHRVALPWCFMFLARRDLVPEAKPNLWCLKISARFTWLLLHLLLYLPLCICSTSCCLMHPPAGASPAPQGRELWGDTSWPAAGCRSPLRRHTLRQLQLPHHPRVLSPNTRGVHAEGKQVCESCRICASKYKAQPTCLAVMGK